MIAGGLGNVRRPHVEKSDCPVGAKLVVLGGPSMLIGLGGGAASSVGAGTSSADLDFASVQRGNPEMQRRAQEVIDRCWALGDDNPILLVHDVGAGGLSNAVPEAVAHSQRGAVIDLRAVPNDEPGMSPMELWCNESQERYVLVVEPGRVVQVEALCRRERCPVAVIGTLTGDGRAARARSAARRHAGRDAARGAARQGAADDARRRHAGAARPQTLELGGSCRCARPPTACCACRRWPTRPSWSRSATAAWGG